MNTKKFLIGGIAGGVIYFLLGYLFYGNLFADFFQKNAGSATGVGRTMDQFLWWSLLLGNIMGGCLLSYIFIRSKVNSLSTGFVTGAVIGLLVAASYDFVSHGVSNLMSTTGVFGDIAVFMIISAIAGAVIGWICGLVGKRAVS